MKAIGEEKIGEKATVSAYAIHVFHVSVNIGKEKFGKWLMISQICQFFLLATKIFLCTVCYYYPRAKGASKN